MGEDTPEEPMEIGALAPLREPRAEVPKKDKMEELTRRMDGMSKEFTKLVAFVKNSKGTEASRTNPNPVNERSRRRAPPARTSDRPPLKFTEDGRPICALCDQVGHLRRECRGSKGGYGGGRQQGFQGGR